jgi:chemotaxis protein CheX
MKAAFINPFLSAVIEILATMAQIEAKPGKPEAKKNSKNLGEFTAIIDMHGAKVSGSLAISFPKPVIVAIAKNMLGEPEENNSALKDMTGEIVNMMTGVAKNALGELDYEFDMATPALMHSTEEYEVNHTVKGTAIVLPFTTVAGEFYVEVCFIVK